MKFETSTEKSALMLGLGVIGTFFVGYVFVNLIPSFNENWSINTAKDKQYFHQPYTAQQLRGRRIYQREGCVYCHTQQIRPLEAEMTRYSVGSSLAIPADEREYIYDRPHFLGTRRIGPDLSRVGGKYSDDWQLTHLNDPRHLVPASVMPAFTWLFKPDSDGTPVPTQDALDIVSYIQVLGFERLIHDPTTYHTNGGWGPWLRPKDRQASQDLSEGMVERVTNPHDAVRHTGPATPSNLIPEQSKP